MSWLFYIMVPLAGALGAMGMGGGTILIPALVFFGSMTQHGAQAYNLIAFVPLAIFSLIIHTKNKLVDFKAALICALFAACAAVGTSFAAQKIDGKVLSKVLGGFLILLAAVQFFILIRKEVLRARQKKKDASAPEVVIFTEKDKKN